MNPVSLTRLTELLDAYGADPARWPEAERAAALQLLVDSAPARQSLEDARTLDAALDHWQPAPPGAQLQERLRAVMPRARASWRTLLAQLWSELGGWRLAGPAFAASLVIGALAPLWVANAGGDLPDEDLIAAVQFIDEPPE